MKTYDIEQNSDAWYDVKKGKFSASKCADLLMDAKYKGYQKLIIKVAYERITGEYAIDFEGNQYTERGHELEPEARESYEFENSFKVDQVGFIEKDEWTGCSPDGLIGEDGLLEIKCLGYKAHIDILTNKKIDSKYIKQIQFSLFVTNKKWCDYYSYHPKLKSYQERIYPDLEMIKQIKDKIEIAKKDVINLMEKLK